MTRTNVLDPNRTGKDATDLEMDEAIEQIARVYQIHRTGLSREGRPIGNFLVPGPTWWSKSTTIPPTPISRT
jgi:hypothetical protein